jgi:hypothetical protein
LFHHPLSVSFPASVEMAAASDTGSVRGRQVTEL